VAAAAEFGTDQSAILGKTVNIVTIGDEAAVDAALAAYNALSDGAKALLTTEKALLDTLKTKIDELKDAVPVNGGLSITVSLNFDEVTITGYTGSIVLSRTAGEGKITSLTLNAAGYDTVKWYIDGDVTGTATGSITLAAASYDVRNHSITFRGVKDGVLYSRLLPFTVEN
jgi:hypothetical protein